MKQIKTLQIKTMSVCSLLLLPLAAEAQYPQITQAAQEKFDSLQRVWTAHSDSAWAVAFPIVKKEKITYESTANGSVAYFLKVDGDTILVINNHLEGTHLSANDRSRYKDLLRGRMDNDTARAESRFLVHKITDAAATRAPQAEAVHAYIEAHRQYPIIVCGDFNDPPISYSRRTIGQGLTDCFVARGKGLGLSYNQKGFFFRIDHILCSDHFEPYQCIVDDKIDFSDHNPVVCWLKFKKND